MFRRRAFLHWYTAEGMDVMEFTEVTMATYCCTTVRGFHFARVEARVTSGLRLARETGNRAGGLLLFFS